MSDLDWMDEPISVDWTATRILRPTRLGSVLIGLEHSAPGGRIREEQRHRAAALLGAMGVRPAQLSDNQVAQIVAVLKGYVPGFTVAAPREGVDVGSAFDVQWVRPAVGRKPNWPPERLRLLLNEVEKIKAAGRAPSDRAALMLIRNDHKLNRREGDLPTLKKLQERLKQARALDAPEMG